MPSGRTSYHSEVKPDFAIEIVGELRARGHEAYLVGGCVRDMVMRLEPSDYDIATSAAPEEVMRIFPHTEPIGAQFGVVLVIHRGRPFEVATFRSDDAYVDGRRPTGVTFSDARTDVLRRDFTINGLLYDPIENRVIDYVSGQEDIRLGIVRAIGDPVRRFTEDKLRLMRAVRFAARFGYAVEPATWDAVRRLAPEIGQVSAERIRDELTRILTDGRAQAGGRLLKEAGLLAKILPELSWNERLDRALGMIPARIEADFALGVVLHQLAPGTVQSICERLKLSRAETAHAVSLIQSLAVFPSLRALPVSALKRLLRTPRFAEHLELARIQAVSAGNELGDVDFAAARMSEWAAPEDLAPAPLLTGDDLIDLKLAPGPLFRTILTRVEDEQLEGRLTTRDQALDFVRRQFSR